MAYERRAKLFHYDRGTGTTAAVLTAAVVISDGAEYEPSRQPLGQLTNGAIVLGGCSWSEFQQSVITVQEAQLGIRHYLMHRYAGPDRISHGLLLPSPIKNLGNCSR